MFEITIIVATLLGPILAVQAQKWLERRREDRNRRLQVFKALMSTRASRLSPESVQALNMIDLEFVGKKFLGVRTAWRQYLDHVGIEQKDRSEAQITVWVEKLNDLYVEVLYEIGKSLGYDFDRVQIKKGIYSPIFLGELDTELTSIRKALNSLLTGKHALKMHVVDFPDMVDSDAQRKIFEVVALLLAGEDKTKILDSLKETPLLEHNLDETQQTSAD